MTFGDGWPAAQVGSHPPARLATPSIASSYEGLIATLPAELRPLARGLPRKLGLTTAAEGGWDDFLGLHPNRELPVYAAEASPVSAPIAVESSAVARFVRAHHAGAFAWLLDDRLADGQVAADERLQELARLFSQNWWGTLVEATGLPSLVDELVGDATLRWRYATALERRPPEPGKLRPASYALLTLDKLRWIGVPARALLLAGAGGGREPAFRQAHDLFLLSLQAIDDVIDRDEDRRLRGGDVPTALGCSPGALLRTAPLLANRGAAAANDAGFTWFGSWLAAWSRAIRCWRLEGDAVDDELVSIAIAGQIEEAVVTDGGPGRA